MRLKTNKQNPFQNTCKGFLYYGFKMKQFLKNIFFTLQIISINSFVITKQKQFQSYKIIYNININNDNKQNYVIS